MIIMTNISIVLFSLKLPNRNYSTKVSPCNIYIPFITDEATINIHISPTNSCFFFKENMSCVQWDFNYFRAIL